MNEGRILVLSQRMLLFALLSLVAADCAGQANVVTDTSPHQVKFVALGGIKLEVLDWGGTGRPVVLLAGIGNTAHEFDKFAPKLAARFHVYGITRRGIGASGESEIGYTSDELGDDIVAVLDSLHLDRPVLIGHSFAGEELSSVGTRHPERVAGLVYLDAAYAYALYSESRGDYFDEPRYFVDMAALQQELNLLFPTNDVTRNAENEHLLEELLNTTLPQFEKDLMDRLKELKRESRLLTAPVHELPPISPTQPGMDKRSLALFAGMQKYKKIQVPVLAIYAIPVDLSSRDKQEQAAAEARETFREQQANAFAKAVPQARVVRMAHATHSVFDSKEPEVLREIVDFVGGLP